VWSFWPRLLLLIHGGAKVEIDTLSYKEGSQAVHWSCDGSPEFPRTHLKERGTTVTLQEEEQEYLESAHPPGKDLLRLSAGANQIGSRGD